MNNIDEQSELVGRVGGKVMDMSDRLEGKEKKRFLYRELNEMPLGGPEFVDDLMTLRYISRNRMGDQEETLQRKLAEHERNLLRLIRESLDERITYNKQLMDGIQDTLVPYYHGRFRMELSREISFLPLGVRLLAYGGLLEREAHPVAKYHILDRISMTLYKSGEERLGEYSVFLQCMLGEKIAPLLFGNKDFEALFSYQIKANQKVGVLREDILGAAELSPEIAGREFWYGFKGFSDLKNVNDVGAAKICLRLFTLYFEKNFSIAGDVETHLLDYYRTKNPNVVRRLLREEQLDELTIKSRYSEGRIGSADGPEELDELGIQRYEQNVGRRAEVQATLHQERMRINSQRARLDESRLVLPATISVSEVGHSLHVLANVMTKNSYTLDQIDEFIGNLLKGVLKSGGWESTRLNILLGTMKEVRTMLWMGNEKDAVKTLRVLKEIMEKPEVECEGWPVCLVINDAVKSSSDYMLIPDSTTERNLFAGAVFVPVPGTLRNSLRGQSNTVEMQIVRPLLMMASDWDKTARNIGFSEKEARTLNKELGKLRENA
ncbi:hypothetical protein [Exiguobacterium acetylicum]|uniref:hypothetical protein n=1 Tax=Exiguobacterium acetylicum TaxID=41170 RepID=UPI001EE37072|nr:hypothetical protein [Exiguobacterium acetylicum]UKS57758.1 hypothetical protein K6T22_16870 [Exiguobacterium acetylicum]